MQIGKARIRYHGRSVRAVLFRELEHQHHAATPGRVACGQRCRRNPEARRCARRDRSYGPAAVRRVMGYPAAFLDRQGVVFGPQHHREAKLGPSKMPVTP